MTVRKGGAIKKDLQELKEEIFREFLIFSENGNYHLRRASEGISNLNEKLDRFSEEIKAQKFFDFELLVKK